MKPTCNLACARPDLPHSLHLFADGGQYPLRVTRTEAIVYLPDGTLLRRDKPDAIQALKYDVRAYLARVAA